MRIPDLHFQRANWFLLSVFVTFFCILLWARAQDTYTRTYFSVKNATGGRVKGVAIRPKTLERAPVILYLHDSDESLVKRGIKLRQFAELGFAAVDLEYEERDQSGFESDFSALLEYLENQDWANTSTMAWVGHGAGAGKGLLFAFKYPSSQPQLMVMLAGELQGRILGGGKERLLCPILLIQGGDNTKLQLEESVRLIEMLGESEIAVKRCVLEGYSHHFGRDEDVVIRHIAEYCASHFDRSGKSYTNSNQSSLVFLSPIFLVVAVAVWTGWRKLTRVCRPAQRSALLTKFWMLTLVTAFLAVAQTALHLVLPRLSISEKTISLSRTFLVRSEWMNNFDFLTRDKDWFGKPVNHLLTHVELAHLQRTQFYRKPNEAIYRDYVLSPAIGRDSDEWGWRRTFWDAFYPRIRRQKKPVQGAETVARFLRERVGINNQNASRGGVETFWREGVADAQGFEELYVAAMRSVGIGARLDQEKRAELWTGSEWQPAPRPLHFEFPSQQETIVGKN